jgi:hypothetical protein
MKQPIQRILDPAYNYDSGGYVPEYKRDIIKDVLEDLKELSDDELLEFYEKFQAEFKVVIRKEKLNSIKDE